MAPEVVKSQTYGKKVLHHTGVTPFGIFFKLEFLKCSGGCLVCGNFSRGNAGGNIKNIKNLSFKKLLIIFPDIHHFVVFLKIVSSIQGHPPYMKESPMRAMFLIASKGRPEFKSWNTISQRFSFSFETVLNFVGKLMFLLFSALRRF